MKIEELYLKDQFINQDIKYVIGNNIREYDISKANINILLYYNFISKREYDIYYNMNKKEREIAIGNLCREKESINKGLSDGFQIVRKMFIEENQLDFSNILNIRKDSMFLINIIPHKTVFGNIEWSFKNYFTSYYHIFTNLQIFYKSIESIDGIDKSYEIKGINNNSYHLHESFLNFLFEIFDNAQRMKIDDFMNYFQYVYKRYINKEYPIEYYRELNPKSKYRISIKGMNTYFMDYFDEKDKVYVDYGYNRGILENIFKYYSQIYSSVFKTTFKRQKI